MDGRKHERWDLTEIDESQGKWLIGDNNTLEPKESWGIPLWKIGKEMEEYILIIRDKKEDVDKKKFICNRFRELLGECLWDGNLDNLTSIYRDKKADNCLGYDTVAISSFVGNVLVEYPNPKS